MINFVPFSILWDSLEQGIERREQLVRSVASYMVRILIRDKLLYSVLRSLFSLLKQLIGSMIWM